MTNTKTAIAAGLLALLTACTPDGSNLPDDFTQSPLISQHGWQVVQTEIDTHHTLRMFRGNTAPDMPLRTMRYGEAGEFADRIEWYTPADAPIGAIIAYTETMSEAAARRYGTERSFQTIYVVRLEGETSCVLARLEALDNPGLMTDARAVARLAAPDWSCENEYILVLDPTTVQGGSVISAAERQLAMHSEDR